MFHLIKDGKTIVERSTAEQCAAEALVKGWCIIERYGLYFIKGVEIIEAK